ncbi:MAG TPA: tripartite tricarboxylate transporter substrate binding protein [Bacillota bacterium]|nr:tripartite tricarboxylate transporter substrate binding protein [Bacillota bacterium]HOI36798.1 tripartite tricarboxylate transporter substrate binding protein [Bacillota bacterium]
MRLPRVLAPVAILSLVALMFGQVVAAAGFPEKPITYMICFDPGGESDITARLQQKYLEEVLKAKVVITYKVGGGGAVGWSELIRSKPDGYTIAGDNLPHTILQPMQRGDAGYTTEQLKRVYCFESTPCALVVKKDSPFKTLDDFIAFAKKNPGAVTLGGSGSWTANHLGTIELEKAAGVKLTYIPFTGSGSATPALLGGHVTGLMTYTTMAAQQLDKFRILAVAAPKRSAVFPDAPTFQELGYDIVEGAYRGVSVPPNTPENIVKIIADAFEKVNKNPEFAKKMAELAFDLEFMGPAEYTKFIQTRKAYYTDLLKDMDIKQ